MHARCFFGAESAGEFSAFARAGLERLFDRRRTKAARAAEDAAGQQIVLMDEACLDSADTHDLAEFAGWLAWLRVALVIVRQPSPSGALAGQAAPADPDDRKRQGSAQAAENRSIVGLFSPAGDGLCDRHRVQFVWAKTDARARGRPCPRTPRTTNERGKKHKAGRLYRGMYKHCRSGPTRRPAAARRTPSPRPGRANTAGFRAAPRCRRPRASAHRAAHRRH